METFRYVWQFVDTERVYEFLPSVLMLAAIAAVASLYRQCIKKKFGDNLNSVTWIEKNKWKSFFLYYVPAVAVGGPALEELGFRAPLIIAFDGMSSSAAWYALLVSSAIFGLFHFGAVIMFSEISSEKDSGNSQSDNLEEMVESIRIKKGKMILLQKILRVGAASLSGVFIGYYGISCQSIWVCFGIHSLWNLTMPVLVNIIVPLVVLFCLFFILLPVLAFRFLSSLLQAMKSKAVFS